MLVVKDSSLANFNSHSDVLAFAKLCRETSALISISYTAAGQTCAALHTMLMKLT